MAISLPTVSYGLVGVAAVVLALTGTSNHAPPAYPPTPEALRFAAEEAAYPFHDAIIELPTDDARLQGAEAEGANTNCLACHSADMILNQPRLARGTWVEEVDKMRRTYHAPIAEADVGPIADYLAALPARP